MAENRFLAPTAGIEFRRGPGGRIEAHRTDIDKEAIENQSRQIESAYRKLDELPSEKIMPAWQGLRKFLDQETYKRYFSWRSDYEHYLIFLPFATAPAQQLGLLARHHAGMWPSECFVYLAGQHRTNVAILNPLATHLAVPKNDPESISLMIRQSFYQIRSWFESEVASITNLPHWAGAVRKDGRNEIYHIMYWYPEVYSADFPVGLYPDFKDPNGGYCQRYNLDEIQNYQPDDLLKASLDLALDHLFNAQGRYNHIARALGLIQDDDRWSLSLNSLSDEEAEAAYQNYATSFVYSLYRQYVQWLIAYKNRYDPSLKSLAAENNPLALRFTKEFDIASKAFSLLWEQHGEGQYFPDEIRVEWLEQSFSLKILELSLNWWAEILSLENWQPLGTYPYFIYLKDDGMYAKLARIFIGRDFQLTQFAHRLYIPNYFALTREKRIGLWDFMSAKYEGIVDTEQKNIVFNRFLSKIRREGKGVSVLDLCCGDGMFGRAYLEGGYSLELQGLDFSPEMLQRARLTGAYQRLHEGNLDDGLNDLPNFDGILLSFAIHLIEENQHLTLFKQVYDKLKMGGIFMLNFYEPLSNWKEAYTHIFQEIGFEVIEIVDEKAGDKDIKAMVLRKNY